MYKATETPEEAQQTEAQTATNVPKLADKTDEQVNKTVDQCADNTAPSPDETADDDFDLSDISARKQSREEIIEAAEAAAFGE